MNPKRNAVTLVETIVVISIIGVLIALILPAIQYSRAMYDGLLCKANLKQISLALHNFHHDYGRLPPLVGNAINDRLYSRASWRVQLLPYIEQDALWKDAAAAFLITTNDFENPPHTGYSRVVKLYTCPSDSRLSESQVDSAGVLAGFSSYIGVSGANGKRGMFGNIPGVSFNSVTDGLSNTLFIGERPPPANFMAGHWYANPGYSFLTTQQRAVMWPNEFMKVVGERILYETTCVQDFSFRAGTLDNLCDRGHYWSLHPGGAHFSCVDGSVRFFSYSAVDVVNAMATRAGGEPVTIED